MAVLATKPGWQRLLLDAPAVGDGAVQALVEARQDALHTLDLSGTRLTDAGCVWVAQLRGLVAIDLNRTAIGDAGALALATLPALQGATTPALTPIVAGTIDPKPVAADTGLGLAGTRIGDTGLAALSIHEKTTPITVNSNRNRSLMSTEPSARQSHILANPLVLQTLNAPPSLWS